MVRQKSVNVFCVSLLFLIGSWITITGCSAQPNEVKALEICARQFNLSENDAGLLMFVTVGADDYEVYAEEKNKCLVDCVARESGYLNAADEFNVSTFAEKVMSDCAATVDNWEGWDRKNKCQKGYLFFKCKSYGEKLFKEYMELQRKLATGELEPVGSLTSGENSDEEDGAHRSQFIVAQGKTLVE